MNTQQARLKRLERVARAEEEELLRWSREDMEVYEREHGPVQPASPEMMAALNWDRLCDLTDAELQSVIKHNILQSNIFQREAEQQR